MMWLNRLFKIYQGPVIDIRKGRCGELRYVAQSKYAAAYYEISGVPQFDLLVSLSSMKVWSDGSFISTTEKSIILSEFEFWSKQKRVVCQWSSF